MTRKSTHLKYAIINKTTLLNCSYMCWPTMSEPEASLKTDKRGDFKCYRGVKYILAPNRDFLLQVISSKGEVKR